MRIAALLAVAALVACAPKEEMPAADSPAPAAAAPTLADFAGTWNLAVVLEGVPDTIRSTMTGTPDGTWTTSLEGRPNIPTTAAMSGDSIVITTAEYESILRQGVMTTVRSAGMKMGDNMMHGTVQVTYKTPTGDQIVNGTFNGTKTP